MSHRLMRRKGDLFEHFRQIISHSQDEQVSIKAISGRPKSERDSKKM